MVTPWSLRVEAGQASQEDMRFLIALLASRDGVVCQSARECLVSVGRRASPRLIAAVRDRRALARGRGLDRAA
jgi:hypothetical protein